jgi:glycosyltransferase involved in cell wall biosynthesis
MKAGVLCAGLWAPGELSGMEKFAVRAAQALRDEGHEVELLASGRGSSRLLARAFGRPLRGVRLRDISPLMRGGGRRLIALTASYDLFLNNWPGLAVPSFAPRSWLWVHSVGRSAPEHLGFYGILANSRFTRCRIRRAWRRDSQVLYGPVDVRRAVFPPKERIILSAGRLHSAGAPKRELELIRLFGALHRRGRLPGWTYHIAGVMDPADRRWAAKLAAAARGLPVRLHLNASCRELDRLYGRASLLWHGCGSEHFGIVLVEAMARGCLPLAPAHGGPAEILRDGETGFLYRSWEDLARKTVAAVGAGAGALRRMRARAAARARRFGERDFRRELRILLKRMGRR